MKLDPRVYKAVVFTEEFIADAVCNYFCVNNEALFSQSEFAKDRTIRAIYCKLLLKYGGYCMNDLVLYMRKPPPYMKVLLQLAWKHQTKMDGIIKNMVPYMAKDQIEELQLD
jgi:hypothetical protein